MSISVLYLESALSPQKRVVQAMEPASIQSLAPVGWAHPFVAFVDGKPVLRADWELVIEDGHALAFVDVNSIPQGGGGGGSDALRTVSMIALMVAAPEIGAFMGPGMFGAGVMGMSAAAWTGATMFAGMALVNAILPPPKLPSSQQAAALAAPSPTYTLGAQGNSARLEAAIPEHFGRLPAYPDFAAQPYSEFSGNDQYLYQLLCLGRGQFDIEAIRIDKSPLSSYSDITYEVIQPYGTLNLFPASVVTSIEATGQDMSDAASIGPFIASATGTTANFIGIDYVMQKGLYYGNDDGSLAAKSVTVVAEAQLVNAVGVAIGSWFTLGTETITAATNTPQRASFKYAVTAGRYQVRVHRSDTKDTSTRAGHDVAWAGLRAYLTDTRTFGDVTLIAMRMKATNNLSGQASRKVNVICTRMLPIWTGTGWTGNTATRSISWAMAYACKKAGLTDAQIDLAGLLTLDATWTSRGDYFDARFDNFLSWWEAATKIAQAGRAKPFMQGGVMRVMRDQAATIPVTMFSVRNITPGSFSIDYLMPTAETADSVRASYLDNTAWAPASVTASLPGSTASNPAKVDLFGVTDRDHAYRDGLYFAACNRYRRKNIAFTTEMEGFIPSYGDLIAIQHDMPAWGQGGEVTAWVSGTRTLTLTEQLTWGTGTHYIVLRKRDGSTETPIVVTAGAAPNQVVLATAPSFTPYTGMSEERTHYSFGWQSTYQQMAKVVKASPSSLNSVAIECVNEDSNVHTADMGVTTPVRQTSQLAGYTNAPVVSGVKVTQALYAPDKLIVSWQPAAWADSYTIQQSSNGTDWTTVATAVTGSSAIVTALYGANTKTRVAAVGLSTGPWSGASSMPMDLTPAPVAPVAIAVGGMFSVHVSWSFGDAIKSRSCTEIWWSGTNDRAVAGRLTSEPFPGQEFDHIGLTAGQSGFYWLRVLDTSGTYSPWYPTSATAGLYAVASSDPSALLTQLNKSIGVDQLTAGMATKIELIDLSALKSAVDSAISGTKISSEAFTRANALLDEASARGAAITNEQTIRQAADESMASSISTLTAGLNTASAAIQSEATTRATADAAEAMARTTLATRVGTAESAIQSEATTRATADTAEAAARTTLAARVSGTESAIQTEATTRATADTANANLINQVQVRLDNGDYAVVRQQSSATATKMGVVEAKYLLQVDANGHVAAIQLSSGGDGGALVFLADKFLFVRPDGSGTPVPMMVLGQVNGQTALGVNGNLIIDGSIVARSLNVTNLTAISANIGIATAGRIQNSDNTNYVNLDATGTQVFIKAGDKVSIDAAGSMTLAGPVINGRNLVIASGDHALSGSVVVEGYYMINTGIPIDSWSGENVPYAAMAGTYGSWASNDSNFTADRWGFTCKVVPWTVWSGQSYLWIAARLSSTGMVPSTGAGIRWKLYKVS